MAKSQPLSPAVLHILSALAEEERHGYGIMQEVARQSDSAYRIGPGTLYDNLQRLVDQGLVQQTDRRSDEDPRRRYYRLTPAGGELLGAEIGRLEKLLRKTKVHLQTAKPKRV